MRLNRLSETYALSKVDIRLLTLASDDKIDTRGRIVE